MNLESELEEVKRLRDEMNHDNLFSRKDAVKINERVSSITDRLNKLK
jgi:hypothetical protein